MLKTININVFDKNSFKQAIAEVESLERQLREGLNELCRKLLDEGVDVAKMQLMSFPAVDTGALMASIGHGAFDPASGTGIIYAGAYYAFFVEYGTGMRGAANPHPGASGSDFAVLGRDGSRTYERYNSDKPGWYYVGDDGKWHYTEGMPSRPFMFNTLMTLADKAAEMGGEVIGSFIV